VGKPGCSHPPHDPLRDLLVRASEHAADDAVARWLARLAEGEATASDDEAAPEPAARD
jgi:hypothetical protein